MYFGGLCLGVVLVALFTCMLGFSPAKAASPFQTPGYFHTNPKAYDAINLAKAYELGFTGNGVILGVQDNGVDFRHSEFANKYFSFLTDPGLVINWEKTTHGTARSGQHGGSQGRCWHARRLL